jgi:hypothetical protein
MSNIGVAVGIDVRPNESEGLKSSFSGLARTAGTVFPVIAPYAAAASVAVASVQSLVNRLKDNDEVIRCTMEFYPASRSYGDPLRQGIYVVFGKDVDGSQFCVQDERDCRVYTRDGHEPEEDYAVFTIEAGEFPGREYVAEQEVAGILTLLNQKDRDSTSAGLNFLRDALKAQASFQALSRYNELKAKGGKDPNSLSESEKKLMVTLAAKEDVKGFISSQAE